MKKQILEHSISIISVAVIFAVLIFVINKQNKEIQSTEKIFLPKEYEVNNFEIDNALNQSLLKETLHIFYNPRTADSLYQLYESEYNRESDNLDKKPAQEFSSENVIQILIMFIKFILVYILVLGLTYYGVQTLAVFRFVSKKQNKPALLIRAINNLKTINKGSGFKQISQTILSSILYLMRAILKLIVYLILFSPAYVIAYSFKTKFDTDSIIFMILLGVISNALLITYAQKFYTFLITEGNKGYVETAIVKNLNNDYSFQAIPISSIFNLKKIFPGHVFNHIFINAQHQYYATVKEQAAFLITGLIIIEMALNIHGHLSYELMQNLLYQKFQLVLVIIFLIYLTVKTTEIFVDLFIFKLNKKYQNN